MNLISFVSPFLYIFQWGIFAFFELCICICVFLSLLVSKCTNGTSLFLHSILNSIWTRSAIIFHIKLLAIRTRDATRGVHTIGFCFSFPSCKLKCFCFFSNRGPDWAARRIKWKILYVVFIYLFPFIYLFTFYSVIKFYFIRFNESDLILSRLSRLARVLMRSLFFFVICCCVDEQKGRDNQK